MASSEQPTTAPKNSQVERSQPGTQQQMVPVVPTEQDKIKQEESEMRLRGGEACPGRFCFIIPCPLPCNFCVFPCPC